MIKARALNKSGDYQEAIKTLKMIMKLPTLKAEEGRKTRRPFVQPSERVSILLELVSALRLNGELVRRASLPPLDLSRLAQRSGCVILPVFIV